MDQTGDKTQAAEAPAANMKTSYYVRDKFKPLKSHQDNIEKLLTQFNEQQRCFLDVIFPQIPSAAGDSASFKQSMLELGAAQRHQGSVNLSSAGPFDSVLGIRDEANRLSSRDKISSEKYAVPPEAVKALKLNFKSLEDIERTKRDFNIYKRT